MIKHHVLDHLYKGYGYRLSAYYTEAIAKALDGLPEAPTVVITVEDGFASFQYIPRDQIRAVNIVLVDTDSLSVGGGIGVTRSDCGNPSGDWTYYNIPDEGENNES